jgi:probable H4MPT-linked C1 transfer pathway protein
MIIGWDIGGAHIKAALLDDKGVVVNVYLQACPLWKGLKYLRDAVNNILTQLPAQPYHHVMTMTGELVDLFDSRNDGVKQITSTLKNLVDNNKLSIYVGEQGFIHASLLKERHYPFIASANWLASASWVAKSVKDALFIDIGSTTTDILLSQNKQLSIQGFSDYQRLQSQELIYTGIIRTAVMALTQTVIFKGKPIGLMAEYFATMADVYRLTGELKEVHDKTDTADGKEKTLLASAKRLSRMIAYEFKESDVNLWKQFAFTLKYYQKQQIQTACQRQLNRGVIDQETYIIGAGIGRFLVKEIATNLERPYKDFDDLFSHDLKDSAITLADCAPAVAVAALYLNLHSC